MRPTVPFETLMPALFAGARIYAYNKVGVRYRIELYTSDMLTVTRPDGASVKARPYAMPAFVRYEVMP